jgi:hypothetical protein
VKANRKDAGLLARLLLAGSLTSVVVPPVQVEAARELMRAHDACRRDLMTTRQRVSKMLLRHGRVYPEPSTWTVAHRRWLARQQFQETASELVFYRPGGRGAGPSAPGKSLCLRRPQIPASGPPPRRGTVFEPQGRRRGRPSAVTDCAECGSEDARAGAT